LCLHAPVGDGGDRFNQTFEVLRLAAAGEVFAGYFPSVIATPSVPHPLLLFKAAGVTGRCRRNRPRDDRERPGVRVLVECVADSAIAAGVELAGVSRR